ncbi:MAG: hypothetical protein KAT69_01455 [Candidatus Aminicenantes bacterium]|nr:hypothetical protein [Candidatus Aminicenantes bacterium]
MMKPARKYPETSCPENEVLINTFLEKGTLEEKERLIDHILVCQKCKLKFEALRQISNQLSAFKGEFKEEKLSASEENEFRRMAKQRIRELSKKQKRPFLRWLPAQYLAVAAATLLIVIAGFILITKLQQREVYREGEKEEFRLIEPVGIITEVPTVFIWTPHEEADNYFFRLIDDELNIVFYKDAYVPKTTLPEDEKKKLVKGKTYIWEVEARDLFHKKIISDRKHFEIKEK